MRLNAPKKNVFMLTLVLAIVAVVLWFLPILNIWSFNNIGHVSFACMAVAYILLAAGNALKGF